MRSLACRLDPRPVAATSAAALLSLTVGAGIVRSPALVRPLTAAAVAGCLVLVATVRARLAILAVFAFLPALELVRRLLIATAGWTSHDALLLVAPLLVLSLFIQLYVTGGRPLAADGLSKLLVAFLFLVLAETFNPRGGGVVPGAAGMLFFGVPLLWFFVGRDLVDWATLATLLRLTVGLATVIAIYGLMQTDYGFPAWDVRWLATTGYAALNVGGRLRAFGTFPSSQEYATYLGVAFVAATAFVMHRKPVWTLTLPLLATATFLASARSVLVTSIFAVIVLAGLRTGSARKATAIIAAAVALLVIAIHEYGPSLASTANATRNPLITHQVLGLTNPLNAQHSTLLLHLNEFEHGILLGIHDPLGSGTAVATIGGSRFGAKVQTTETDISNAFLACGLVGGVLFIAILGVALVRAGSLYFHTKSAVSLAALGVLLVTVGQWLNGGLYTVAPLVWLVVGWIAGVSRRRSSASTRPAPVARAS